MWWAKLKINCLSRTKDIVQTGITSCTELSGMSLKGSRTSCCRWHIHQGHPWRAWPPTQAYPCLTGPAQTRVTKTPQRALLRSFLRGAGKGRTVTGAGNLPTLLWLTLITRLRVDKIVEFKFLRFHLCYVSLFECKWEHILKQRARKNPETRGLWMLF